MSIAGYKLHKVAFEGRVRIGIYNTYSRKMSIHQSVNQGVFLKNQGRL